MPAIIYWHLLFCRSRIQKHPSVLLKYYKEISESELWSIYLDSVLCRVWSETLKNWYTCVRQTQSQLEMVRRVLMLSLSKGCKWYLEKALGMVKLKFINATEASMLYAWTVFGWQCIPKIPLMSISCQLLLLFKFMVNQKSRINCMDEEEKPN